MIKIMIEADSLSSKAMDLNSMALRQEPIPFLGINFIVVQTYLSAAECGNVKVIFELIEYSEHKFEGGKS